MTLVGGADTTAQPAPATATASPSPTTSATSHQRPQRDRQGRHHRARAPPRLTLDETSPNSLRRRHHPLLQPARHQHRQLHRHRHHSDAQSGITASPSRPSSAATARPTRRAPTHHLQLGQHQHRHRQQDRHRHQRQPASPPTRPSPSPPTPPPPPDRASTSPAAPGTPPPPCRSPSTGAPTPAPASTNQRDRRARPGNAHRRQLRHLRRLDNGDTGRRRRHHRPDRHLLPLPPHHHRQRRQHQRTSTTSTTAKIDTTPPTVAVEAPTATAGSANQFYESGAKTLWFRPSGSGSFTLNATAADAQSGVTQIAFPDVSTVSGWAGSTGGTDNTAPVLVSGRLQLDSGCRRARLDDAHRRRTGRALGR